MPDKFFYGRGDQTVGPFTPKQLKELAVAGKLNGEELVWKENSDQKRKASAIKGLMPTPATPVVSSDSAQPQTSAGWMAHASENAKAAGQLVSKQAELTKLRNVSLPNAYQQLGGDLHSSGRHRDEFETEFTAVEEINAQATALKDRPSAPATQTASEKMKAAAGAAKTAAQLKLLSQKRNSALAALGKVAFATHSTTAAAAEFVTPIATLLQHEQDLEQEIKELCETKQGNWITPKRMACAGVGTMILAAFMAMLFLFGGNLTADDILDSYIADPQAASDRFGTEMLHIQGRLARDWGDDGTTVTFHARIIEAHVINGEAFVLVSDYL